MEVTLNRIKICLLSHVKQHCKVVRSRETIFRLKNKHRQGTYYHFNLLKRHIRLNQLVNRSTIKQALGVLDNRLEMKLLCFFLQVNQALRRQALSKPHNAAMLFSHKDREKSRFCRKVFFLRFEKKQKRQEIRYTQAHAYECNAAACTQWLRKNGQKYKSFAQK